MTRQILFSLTASGFFVVVAAAFAQMSGSPGAQPGPADEINSTTLTAAQQRMVATQQFRAANPGADVMHVGEKPSRVYGRSFSQGRSPERSAARFLQEHAAMFGLASNDLAPVGPFPDGRHVQPIMYDRNTGEYKFTGIYYHHTEGGIPVFRSRMMLLVRNEPGYPLVLASADLRDTSGFELGAQAAQNLNVAAGHEAIRARLGGEPRFEDEPAPVVWAGFEGWPQTPRLVVKQIAEIGDVTNPEGYQRWLYLTDAETGDIVYSENQIFHADIIGTVQGRATEGDGADICAPESLMPLPYAIVSGGGQSTFADVDGNFVLSGLDVGDNTIVASPVRGEFFRVNNAGGPDASLSEFVTIPSVIDFIHNDANNSELTRAEVNAYIHSNVVRDFVLGYNPDYPVIANQTDFDVNVNIADSCNASYNGSSINFFTSGGGCPNTAFSSVVYHEYGHHLVETAGSGQGTYGEGMSDCIGVIIDDRPELGIGFGGDCSSSLRNADNTLQYPCSGGIHFCGQVISGCVWDTRNALIASNPSNYRDIIASLTINSILLHTGTSIDPSITIDFLTLDDDNDNIFDGTPHYNEINAGFSAHNMPAPELDPVIFTYPDGLPAIVTPGQAETFRVEVGAVSGVPQSGSGLLNYRFGTSGGFTTVAMDEVSSNVYDATIPAGECGQVVQFYVSVETTDGEVVTSPREAPADLHASFVAADLITVFADDFSDDLGWQVGAPEDDAVSGIWERVNPIGTIAQPGAPFVGDACYVTGQHPGGGDGENDIDDGQTTLFSPALDLEGVEDAIISYQRWYSNDAGATPNADVFEVDVTSDGVNWVNVETVGPAGPETSGGWFANEFRVGDFVDLSDSVQVRFVASDEGEGSLVEAAIDAFNVQEIDCETADPCPADLTGDGSVDVLDLLDVLSAWGACEDCPGDLTGDGQVDVLDLLEVLGAWGACP